MFSPTEKRNWTGAIAVIGITTFGIGFDDGHQNGFGPSSIIFMVLGFTVLSAAFIFARRQTGRTLWSSRRRMAAAAIIGVVGGLGLIGIGSYLLVTGNKNGGFVIAIGGIDFLPWVFAIPYFRRTGKLLLQGHVGESRVGVGAVHASAR